MYPELNTLALVFDPDRSVFDPEDFGVVPFVDGKPLFSEWAGTALYPDEILCVPSPLTSGLPHRVVLRRCSCGNLDSSASAVIWVDGPVIRWTDWKFDLPPEDEDGPEPPVPPPLAFDRGEYERVVAEATARVPIEKRTSRAQVPPWESVVRPGRPGEPDPPPYVTPEGPAVLEAVRAVIAREVERVDDPVAGVPGGDPSDSAGWHPTTPSLRERSRIGRPYYNPETWRWFQLVDLAYLDELVIVEFRWTDPTTPKLRYIFICHVDQVPSAQAAGSIVRVQLRSQLAPGWRERLGHRWLGTDRVLLWRHNEQSHQIRDAASWAL
jgi:hypothetical protein